MKCNIPKLAELHFEIEKDWRESLGMDDKRGKEEKAGQDNKNLPAFI